MFRDGGIGVIVTARFCCNWPSSNLKDINVLLVSFSKLFWTEDKFGILLMQWMDNGLVFLVTTVHTILEVAKYLRKRPRVAQLNKGHANAVCGKL
eukprot:2849027-Ditylum_brightwellii.AAC.1